MQSLSKKLESKDDIKSIVENIISNVDVSAFGFLLNKDSSILPFVKDGNLELIAGSDLSNLDKEVPLTIVSIDKLIIKSYLYNSDNLYLVETVNKDLYYGSSSKISEVLSSIGRELIKNEI